jgi:hypothetical protein
MKNVLHVTHDAGFFSCSTVRFRKIIDYYNNSGILPIVDSSKQWNHYKDDVLYLDITNLLFKTKNTETNKKNIIISFDMGVEDQFSDYQKINYNDVNFFIDRYFSPSSLIEGTIKEFIEKYKIDLNNTISIYYRGNNKSKEVYLPSHEKMIQQLNEVKLKNPDYKILIQTDEVEFCEKVLKFYPDSIVIKELKQINNCDNDVHSLTPFGERFNLGKNLLSAIILISKTSKIILNLGNVGMWICLYRGNYSDVFQVK